MGQIMFLIRWCNLTGFLFMEESLMRNQIWKNGLPGGWSAKHE
jgi:hypothetical protein